MEKKIDEKFSFKTEENLIRKDLHTEHHNMRIQFVARPIP